jgi:hypothetical protein
MSDTIEAVKPIRFTRASRKHRVGKKSAYHVIAMNAATITDDPDTGETTLSWVAGDERGRELEIVAIEKPDCYLVIHVMPTHFRRKGR